MKKCLLLLVSILSSWALYGQSTCSEAVTATEGTNVLPSNTENFYWYHYTMPSDGKLQITSSSNSYVSVYSNTCDDLFYEGEKYENIAITTFSSGDEVLIKWNVFGNSDFEWDLSVGPLETGDNCALAAPAITGANTLPATSNRFYWYAYTMPSDGKLQINSSASERIEVYKNSCDNFRFQDGGYRSLTVTTLSSGDEVFIKWEASNGGDFDWNLTVSPLEPGDECTLAVPATTGTNTLPATLNDQYWYRYTMPSDGKLQITSSSNNYVSVYSNTCNNLLYEGERYENITITTFSSGEEVSIIWDTRGEGDFDWNLSVSPLESGDNCALATPATTGTNMLPATLNDQYWYHYTMPIDGKLEITSSSSRYVSIYTNSCNDLQYESEGFEKASINTLSNGDDVFILWNTRSEGDFDWNLSVSPLEPGDNCALAAAATPGFNTTPEAPFWFQYKVPISGNYTISSVGNSTVDTYLKIYSDCNDKLIEKNDDAKGKLQSELTLSFVAGETIYILWDNTFTTDGFDWTLGGDALKDVDCANLTATAEPTHITCSSAANGSINVSATGGQAPYSYSLDKVNFQEGARFTGLDSGRYEVMVKDVYGCLATIETYIAEPDTIILDAQVGEATEYPGNGVITLTVKGGIAPYSYAWNNGATTSLVRDLSVGTYTVTVTDSLGCTATGNFTIGGVTSVGELQIAEIMVYPNPTRNTVNIDIPVSRPARQGNVYTLTGEKIATINLVRGKNQVDISHLKPGSYILRLDNGSNHRLVVKP